MDRTYLRWLCGFAVLISLVTTSQLSQLWAQATKPADEISSAVQSAASPTVAATAAQLLQETTTTDETAYPVPANFTSRTQLVLVPVVVTDKNGHHLGGLPRAAFKVEEHGHAQEVTTFEEVQTVAPAVRLRSSLSAEGRANFAFDKTQSWRVTMVVMDLLNTPYLYQHEGKQQLIAFLAKSLQREEPTTLFGLDRNGLRQLHSFTTDTGVLIAALKKLQGQEGPDEAGEEEAAMVKTAADRISGGIGIGGGLSQQLADFMNDTVARSNALQERRTIAITLTAMQQIAHAYAAIPGRKTMIWVTGGFPFVIDDPQAFARLGTEMVEMYKETWRDLLAANIAVYTVDVTGAAGSIGETGKQKPSDHLRAIMRPPTGHRSDNPATPYDKSAQKLQTLISFADATGGVACLGTDDLEHCFARAVEDSRAYYMLGYYLAPDDQKPGWRKLKVKVAADGARVRAREGFYVSKPVEETPQLRQQQMVEALLSPVEFTGVPVKMRELPSNAGAKPTAGKTAHEFEVAVLGSSIVVDTRNGNAVDLSVVSVAFTANGKNAGQSERYVLTKLSPEALVKIRKSALGMTQSLELAPGRYELRTVVRDNLRGEIGSVEYPLEIR